jgi:hypothetical protein
MPTFFIRWMLFVSSYFPLILIFWIFLIVPHPIWAWFALSIGALGVGYTFLYVSIVLPARAPVSVTIISYRSRDSEIMGYVATYIVPFATFPFDKWQQIAALLVFIIVLGMVYVNSEMLCINPLLNIFHYRIYEITVNEHAFTYALITRRTSHLKQGDKIRVVDVSNNSRIYLEKDV